MGAATVNKNGWAGRASHRFRRSIVFSFAMMSLAAHWVVKLASRGGAAWEEGLRWLLGVKVAFHGRISSR